MTGTGGDGVPYLGQDDVDLEPGQQVGEYVVDEKIGEGGFGTVFRATHPIIGKQVAIKVLARQYSAQPEMVSRFVAEARAVNQIRHRNIIDIFSFGQLEGDGRHYYVMEFLAGQPMDEYLDDRGRLAMPDAVPILRALARALDAAHSKGIAHRDLKPENVFLVTDADGVVFPKLLDFGIAKLLGSSSPQQHKTRTGAPMGTPAYMSPEQCRGRDVDHRTDIYAFGILAYQVLTGDVPFDGEDYMEVLLKQIGEEPAPPSSRCSALPESVDQGLLWMLAKDPGARPPNLVTAVRALEDAAAAAGIAVPAGPGPTGAYATPTGQPMAAQKTPSGVLPLPQSISERPTAAIGTAETLDARSLSEEIAAVQAGGSPKGIMIAAALAVAVLVGGGVYFAMRGGSGGGETPATAAVEGPATDPIAYKPATVAVGDAAPAGAVADAAPEVPATVTLEIDGPPDGTEVYGPRGLVGVAPGKIQIERGDFPVLLTFKAEGYRTKTAEVKSADETTLSVRLKPKRGKGGKGGKGGRGGKGGKGGRDAIEDPFK
jgi:serine/threonine-protein kinase